MYEVVVDGEDASEEFHYGRIGARFYFKTLKEMCDFIDLCFKTNPEREYVLTRIVNDEDEQV